MNRSIRSRSSRAILAMAGFALVAAACGDDSGSTTTAGDTTAATAATTETTAATPDSAAPAGNAADASKSTVKIGVQGEFSGFSASSNAGSADMAKAWAKWVNETQGGVAGGHPISVNVVDDAGDAAKGLAAFKGFVDNDKAIAMVSGGSTGTITGIEPYAKEKGVPILSGDNYTPTHISSPVVFPINDTIPAIISNVHNQAKELDKTLGVFACAESPACDTDALQKAIAAQVGDKYGGMQKVAFDAPNYTAQCLAAKSAGVGYLQMATSAQGAVRMMADCQKQGYDPIFQIGHTTWDTTIADLKTATIIGPINSLPFFSTSDLAKPMNEAWTKYGPGGRIPTQQAAITFQSLELFRKVAGTIAAPEPTAADMMAALGKVKDENLGGVLPNKLTWTAGQAAAPPNFCYFVVKNEKGVLSEDLTPKCDAPVKLG
jgi:branched-chain amino acid transport system substrate-binding protein